MPVDSFKFLPRLIEMFYKMTEVESPGPIPWTPLQKRIQESRFGLVTSAGLFNKAKDQPFDLQRELQEPTWGDPTAREIKGPFSKQEIGVSHLHYNNQPVLDDPNIVLPLDRLHELEQMGEIGGLAETHFSIMGYQGFPPDTSTWRKVTGPWIADRFKTESVDCVLLTPA
jgi:D-proline reductase (dithiol) PrdB